MSENSGGQNNNKINPAVQKYKKVYLSAQKIQKEKNVTVESLKRASSYEAMAEDLQQIESIDLLSNILKLPRDDIIPIICKTDTMTQIIDSIKYLRDKYCNIEYTMERVSAQTRSQKSMEKTMKKAVREFQQTEQMITTAMEPDEVLNGISSYYNTLSEMQIDSKTFGDVVKEFSPLPDDLDETSNKPGFWDRFMKIIPIISEKIKDIKTRVSNMLQKIKGSVSELGNALILNLDNLSKALTDFFNAGIAGASKLKDKIIEELRVASTKLQSLIFKLIEKMFDFLSRFGQLAKTKGFPVSKVEIKAPTIKFEYTSVFGFSIPIPGLSGPEMTITLTPPT